MWKKERTDEILFPELWEPNTATIGLQEPEFASVCFKKIESSSVLLIIKKQCIKNKYLKNLFSSIIWMAEFIKSGLSPSYEVYNGKR